jgi:excisionase family DNA binding protein
MPAQTQFRPVTHRYASLAAGAEYAHCSIKTLRRRISDGSLTGYRMGPRLIRVDLNELDTLLRPIPTAGACA